MNTLSKVLSGALVVFGFLLVGLPILISVFIGPGGAIALAEWPFGTGPFSSQGSYCTDMHRFSSDISIAISNPTSQNLSTVQTAYGGLLSSAPDQVVANDLQNWLSAQQSQDIQQVKSASTALNQWITATCSSPAYKFPYEINQFYNGIFGPF